MTGTTIQIVNDAGQKGNEIAGKLAEAFQKNPAIVGKLTANNIVGLQIAANGTIYPFMEGREPTNGYAGVDVATAAKLLQSGVLGEINQAAGINMEAANCVPGSRTPVPCLQPTPAAKSR